MAPTRHTLLDKHKLQVANCMHYMYRAELATREINIYLFCSQADRLRRTSAVLVSSPIKEERVWWHLVASILVNYQSQCRKHNSCNAGRLDLLQQDTAYSHTRTQLIYLYTENYELLIRPEESAEYHQTLSSRELGLGMRPILNCKAPNTGRLYQETKFLTNWYNIN